MDVAHFQSNEWNNLSTEIAIRIFKLINLKCKTDVHCSHSSPFTADGKSSHKRRNEEPLRVPISTLRTSASLRLSMDCYYGVGFVFLFPFGRQLLDVLHRNDWFPLHVNTTIQRISSITFSVFPFSESIQIRKTTRQKCHSNWLRKWMGEWWGSEARALSCF